MNIVANDLQAVTLKLVAYCQGNDWAGYEPYGAPDSRILAALPFLNFGLFRLFLTQALKRKSH